MHNIHGYDYRKKTKRMVMNTCDRLTHNEIFLRNLHKQLFILIKYNFMPDLYKYFPVQEIKIINWLVPARKFDVCRNPHTDQWHVSPTPLFRSCINRENNYPSPAGGMPLTFHLLDCGSSIIISS